VWFLSGAGWNYSSIFNQNFLLVLLNKKFTAKSCAEIYPHSQHDLNIQ